MPSPFTPASIPSSGSSSGGGSSLLPIVAPFPPELVNGTINFGANGMGAVRVVIPTAGTLTDLSAYIASSSGNYDAAVYSTAAPRARLWSKGSTASPGTGWQVLGNPALSVAAGDQYDFAWAADNGTFAVGVFVSQAAAVNLLPASFTMGQVGVPRLAWAVAASFPLPASVAEASFVATQHVTCLIARIT